MTLGLHTKVSLTNEQQALVAHDKEPALVFAVAGRRTTTMVRRIERLVRGKVVRPERMLATSFGKANVQDLKRALKSYLHTLKVYVKTLPALAYQMLQDAMRLNRLLEQKLPENSDDGAQLILSEALMLARQSDFRWELDALDRKDFLDLVGAQKAVLAFLPQCYRKLPQDSVATEVDSDPYIT